MMTDPRNQHVKHYINGRFVSQYEAAIPLFDAGFYTASKCGAHLDSSTTIFSDSKII